MPKPVKIIFVGASWADFNKELKSISQEVAKSKGLEFEEKQEDYVFLTKYGEKDEFGGADIPQVFVVYDNGKIKHVLTKVPIVGTKPDFEAARRKIEEALS
ncbi:MAG: hypothetical protein ACPLRJ_07350 [Infirmifilum uzonense]|jgi:hypothetical protein|uniref:Thioredoxin domain-containing protein n=1 Tax=Infirmifilum uzonense TaxID=1550241 RepID=A0A0F7CKP2_9CREN|nr:hypothetical protein [Infirmifilum uzonense]AKG38006.1 hypothetical protein MA03_00020 [Infirmifilum uzonense]